VVAIEQRVSQWLQVTYTTKQWLDKNRDALSVDIGVILLTCLPHYEIVTFQQVLPSAAAQSISSWQPSIA
jgi:hypothetical protein